MATILGILTLAANWRIFQKMGRKGWEGLIPFYNLYVLFEEIQGNGMRIFLMLIPLFNIYVIIKLNLDMARAFNQTTAFGWGLVLLNTIFLLILAFGDSQFEDGSRMRQDDDPISRALDSASQGVHRMAYGTESGKDIADKLKELNELRSANLITEEEYQRKREELMKRF